MTLGRTDMPRFDIKTTACAFAALLATTFPVQAQTAPCPSGAAVDGVYVSFADRVVRYERLSTGMTSELETAFDGSFVFGYRTHPIGLVATSWELVDGRIVEGSLETVEIDGPPLPMPVAGVTWRGVDTSRFTDGTVDVSDTEITVGSAETLQIGPCGYAGLPITVSRVSRTDGMISQEAFGYLSDLGIVMYLGFGEGSDAISFDMPMAISDLPPHSSGRATVLDTK